MNPAGNEEFAPPAIAAKLRGGELPAHLPLEGWQTVTVHGQVDAIGPSDRHPDLVKLELSFPPGAGRPLQFVRLHCPTCGWTEVEEYRHRSRTLRCVNCKEHLASGQLDGAPHLGEID